jgi:hypothetical protein
MDKQDISSRGPSQGSGRDLGESWRFNEPRKPERMLAGKVLLRQASADGRKKDTRSRHLRNTSLPGCKIGSVWDATPQMPGRLRQPEAVGSGGSR